MIKMRSYVNDTMSEMPKGLPSAGPYLAGFELHDSNEMLRLKLWVSPCAQYQGYQPGLRRVDLDHGV